MSGIESVVHEACCLRDQHAVGQLWLLVCEKGRAKMEEEGCSLDVSCPRCNRRYLVTLSPGVDPEIVALPTEETAARIGLCVAAAGSWAAAIVGGIGFATLGYWDERIGCLAVGMLALPMAVKLTLMSCKRGA